MLIGMKRRRRRRRRVIRISRGRIIIRGIIVRRRSII